MSFHVLIVEDSPLVTGALRVLFEATGHRVSEASTVADALRCCAEDFPEVMLLDLTLADGDGTRIMETLLANDARIPLTVVLTGRDDPEVIARCLALGCRDVLLKPVPPRVLLNRLEELRSMPVSAPQRPSPRRDPSRR